MSRKGDDVTVACVDDAGRYDGPAFGNQGRGAERIEFRGRFEREAPAGSWVCTRLPGRERLEFEVDPARWAKVLWGMELSAIGKMKHAHLAPFPAEMCPRGDWARLAREGFVLDAPMDQLGDLVKLGVLSRVRHGSADDSHASPTSGKSM